MLKKIFYIFLSLLPMAAFTQTPGYILKSKVASLNPPAKAYLVYRKGNVMVVDSSAIRNGMFEFRGMIGEPVRATLVIDHKGAGLNKLQKADALSLYLEKGIIAVESADSIIRGKVTGTKTNLENQRFSEGFKAINNRLGDLIKEFNSAPRDKQQSPEFREGFQKRAEAIEKEQGEFSKKFVAENPNSFVSLDVLVSYGGYYPEYNEVQPLFDALDSHIKMSVIGKEFAKTIERVRLTALGAAAPDFTQNDPDGKPVNIKDFRGKYVLIDFWAAWCGPCRQENPNVVANYEKYKDKNFTVLGVSLDRPGDKTKWMKAIADDKLMWTHVSELNYFENSAAVKYGVISIPQNYLIDPQGKIIGKNLRGEFLGKKLEELLK